MVSIRAMRYDEVSQVLTVDFRNWGGTKRYFDVPPSEWAQLQTVFAKAAYLQNVIAHKHRSEALMAA
jgi:hypothetical protein